jgi:hypothetical protein
MPEDTTTRPPAQPVLPAVAVLRWPAHEEERRSLAALGRPRILVTGPDVTPPSLLDDREVWLRGGCDAAVVVDAMERLRHGAGMAFGRPLLDEDGLLRYAGRWVDVVPAQVGVVGLLVRSYGRIVPHEDVRAAYLRGGRQVSSASIRALVKRLDARVSLVGLRLHNVRRRGIVLAPSGPADPAAAASAGS